MSNGYTHKRSLKRERSQTPPPPAIRIRKLKPPKNNRCKKQRGSITKEAFLAECKPLELNIRRTRSQAATPSPQRRQRRHARKPDHHVATHTSEYNAYLQKRVEKNKKDLEQAAKDQALWIAIDKCNSNLVRTAIKAGALVNTCNTHGETPLIRCIQKGWYEGLICLLKLGADINSRVNNTTKGEYRFSPFTYAYYHKNRKFKLAALKALAKKGDENTKGFPIATALNMAIRERDYKVIHAMYPDEAEEIIERVERNRLKTPAAYRHYLAKQQAAAGTFVTEEEDVKEACYEEPVFTVTAAPQPVVATRKPRSLKIQPRRRQAHTNSQKTRNLQGKENKTPRSVPKPSTTRRKEERVRIVIGKPINATKKGIVPAVVQALVPVADHTDFVYETKSKKDRSQSFMVVQQQKAPKSDAVKRWERKVEQHAHRKPCRSLLLREMPNKHECVICSYEVTLPNSAAKYHLYLPCEHGREMHKWCLRTWYETQASSEKTCPICVSTKIKNLNPQLLAAAAEGNTTKVAELLDKGANIETKNDLVQTPLLLAIEHGHVEVVKQLLKAGAKTDIYNHYRETPVLGPLFQALELAKTNKAYAFEIMDLLTQHNKELINSVNMEKLTVLQVAVAEQNIYAVKKLIALGANVNYISEVEPDTDEGYVEFEYALAIAVRLNNLELITLLLEAGANIALHKEIPEVPSLTSLAAATGNLELFMFLIKAGASATSDDYALYYQVSGDKVWTTARRAYRYLSSFIAT